MADLVAAQHALTAAQDRKRRRAMGRPLALSDAALDALSAVGDADVAAAAALWRMANPGPLAMLLEAETVERI